jgi:mRNA interferase RelE/StbE
VTDYDIAFTAHAHRLMNRLPEKAAAAALEFLHASVASNPRRTGKPLRFGLVGRHSARRGDYRIIYVIDDENHRVIVEVIEHRADAYRPRS